MQWQILKIVPSVVIILICLGSSQLALSFSGSQEPLKVPTASNRIRNEPESVWVEFIQLALDHKPLNLGQGFPDFAAPTYLVESLENATRLSDPSNVLNHQYTRSFGHPKLVKALQKYYNNFRGFRNFSDAKSQVLVTVGAYEALFTSIMAFVNPDDEVIIIDPAFDAYAPMVELAGGKSVFVPLRLSNEKKSNSPEPASVSSSAYRLDLDELRANINTKTRAIVLNTPNNPMGKVFSRNELDGIAKVCIDNNLLVIADEVYEQFYYDHNEHISIASLPGMWPRTITIGSAGKTFSVTGWKIGWVFGPEHLIRYLQLMHQNAVYTVATPLQEAVARALEHETTLLMEHSSNNLTVIKSVSLMGTSSKKKENLYWSQLRDELTMKRNRMAKVLERAQMRPIVPQGGYFMMTDFSKLAKLFPDYENIGEYKTNQSSRAVNTNDYRFARWLSKEKHLQGIPGGAFYSPKNKALGGNLIRFCFIKKDETLDKFEKLINSLINQQAQN